MELLRKMSKELFLDEDYILDLSKRTFYCYKKYDKVCKNAKKRTIYEPSQELKTLQYWVLNRVLSNIPVSEYSMAYEKGCSVRKNAYVHKSSNYILHTDITNFFESIQPRYIANLFRNTYSSEEVKFLLDIILLNGKLVVGSITAPKIANCIMYQFDIEIVNELNQFQNIIYSRYADDIVISSMTYIDPILLTKIQEKLQYIGLSINKKKTYYSSKKDKRLVTGVVIDNNNNSLSIGWKKYKLLKSQIYKYLIHTDGLDNHELDSVRKKEKEVLIGKIAYLKSVDGNRYLALKRSFRDYRSYEELFN